MTFMNIDLQINLREVCIVLSAELFKKNYSYLMSET